MKQSPLIPLDSLNIGESGFICTLPENIDIRHRLMSLGLIIGTRITVVNQTATCDTKAYFFRSSLIALRHNDAKTVLVKKFHEQSDSSF